MLEIVMVFKNKIILAKTMNIILVLGRKNKRSNVYPFSCCKCLGEKINVIFLPYWKALSLNVLNQVGS